LGRGRKKKEEKAWGQAGLDEDLHLSSPDDCCIYAHDKETVQSNWQPLRRMAPHRKGHAKEMGK
jgi:hypothetical protein